MTMICKKLPAVLLAVVVAAAMSFVLIPWQQAYAASSDSYYVWIETADGQYTYLPGEGVTLSAHYQKDSSSTMPSQVRMTYKWKLTKGTAYASLKPKKSSNEFANLKFKSLKEGKKILLEDVNVQLTVYAGGKKVGRETISLTVCNDFVQLTPGKLQTEWLNVNDSITAIPEVQHCTAKHPKGGKAVKSREPLDNVTFTWLYDGKNFDVTCDGAKTTGKVSERKTTYTGTSPKFTIKRLTGQFDMLVLTASWKEGKKKQEDGHAYAMEEIPTNLNDYTVAVNPDDEDWRYNVNGKSFKLEDVHVRVETTNWTLDGGKDAPYTLKVDRYHYNEKTGKETYTKVDATKPIKLDADGSGIFRITAVAKKGSGYTGKTKSYPGYLFAYDRHSVASLQTEIKMDSHYLKFVDDFPYLEYEVTPGKVLKPAVYVFKKKLTVNKDYTLEYVNADTGKIYKKFPKKKGMYYIKVTGKGNYYGVNEKDTWIKIAKKSKLKVSGKTVSVKAGKTVKFKKSTAFKVKNAKGKVSFEKISGNKKILVSSKGMITVKKGLKKGKTYTVKVKVSDQGNKTYFAGSKTAKVKVRIK